MNRHPSVLLRLLALALFASAPLAADWKDDIGHTRLLQTFTSGVPAKLTAGFTLVEAPYGPNASYMPDAANAEMVGKTLNNQGSNTTSSWHATEAGKYLFGNFNSLVPATDQIDIYHVNDWIAALYYPETRRVQNHSWISLSGNTEAAVAQINKILDYQTITNGTIRVVGVDNGNHTATMLPQLLCQGYNQISVGLTNGNHTAGFTVHDGAGRIKPDIVAPDQYYTSFSTPRVASAAALLAEKLIAAPHALTGANIPLAAKALLLTGATKEKFPAWERTAARPLDLRYGAGELNTLLSYRTLLSGRASYNSLAANTAWALEEVRSTLAHTRRTYFFEIPTDSTSATFAASLVWHRSVTYSSLTGFSATLANLDITLHAVAPDTLTVGAALQTSSSSVDNLEHIYVPQLPPGRYALRITSDSSTDTPYALAWRSTPTVTIAATAPVARELDGAPGQFTVTRTGPTTTPLLVPLLVGGSAVSGSHYTTLPAHVLIPADASTVTLQVTPVSDNLAQGDRTVTVSLVTDYSLAAGTPSSASVTIEDKPLGSWLHARFTAPQLADPLVSGDTADPDADGVSNLLEYAFGLEPLSADTPASSPDRLPATGLDTANRLALSYFHAADRADLVFAVEYTTDLSAPAWLTGPAHVEEISRDPLPGGERVTVRTLAPAAPETAPRQFLRLRVTRQ